MDGVVVLGSPQPTSHTPLGILAACVLVSVVAVTCGRRPQEMMRQGQPSIFKQEVTVCQNSESRNACPEPTRHKRKRYARCAPRTSIPPPKFCSVGGLLGLCVDTRCARFNYPCATLLQQMGRQRHDRCDERARRCCVSYGQSAGVQQFTTTTGSDQHEVQATPGAELALVRQHASLWGQLHLQQEHDTGLDGVGGLTAHTREYSTERTSLRSNALSLSLALALGGGEIESPPAAGVVDRGTPGQVRSGIDNRRQRASSDCSSV